ncbi:MAG: type 1 glutamine amidotransferase [Actinomycetota bacterium]|nr:type 1 glutamine amidotransferase [Actinomycetota bacterium]
MSEQAVVPILVVENARDAPVARLGDWLVAAGAELDVRALHAGDELPELAGYRALVVLGGGMNAYDDVRAPWLPAVRALLSEAVRIELPTLGICLGGQLLAVATGGRVALAQAPEYGAQLIAKRQAAATDPLLREMPITPDVLQWHVDEISQLPPGAVQLASSPGCELQAFRVGRLAWGTQFHLETTPDIIAQWAAEDAELLADYDLPTIVERAVRAHEDIAEVWQPIAARFVEIARDPAAVAGPRSLPMAGGTVSTAAPITDPAAIRAALAAEMQAARGPHGQ